MSEGRHKGRGASANPANRYFPTCREEFDDGWNGDDSLPPMRTTVSELRPRRILSRNQSPDLPFDRSINPYQGCEHGCIYCYARPSHAWLDLSPGLDFETRLFAKPQAAGLLERELVRPGYHCRPIALGANTDPYQPIERRYRITRSLLELMLEWNHPVTIVTKSVLVERDLDLLAELAGRDLVQVAISITSLERHLNRVMEPRAASPEARLRVLHRLSAVGVPTAVMFAPVIPMLNDKDLEAVLEAAAQAGAREADYVMLRLPLEVAELFQAWLQEHFPERAGRVMNRVRELRGGRDNDPRFGKRLRGEGIWADLIRQRFSRACRKLGLNRSRVRLDCSRFAPPSRPGQQLELL